MNDTQLLRYSRHILLPKIDIEGQECLLNARVLLVGVGGLGSPIALYLAAAGVGQIWLSDHDTVDLSNLQRQIIHQEGRIGYNKAASAQQQIHAINPDVQCHLITERMDTAQLAHIVPQVDVVIDASDNFATRHAINAACVAAKKPLVSGAAVRFDGQISVFDSRQAGAPCYHCLFPDEGEAQDMPCAQMGVFSPMVGIIGSMQAAEALKLLLGIGNTLQGRLLVLDGLAMQWRTLHFTQDPSCPVCHPATKPSVP